MKGLLLKDFYALKSYFKSFIILMAVFLVLPLVSESSAFIKLYPCIVCCMIGVSLISYEEKEKWHIYAATLPYSRGQIVSAKYIISLFFSVVTVIVITVVDIIVAVRGDFFSIENTFGLISVLIAATLIPASVMLPFIYKFGAEKGRICYYIIIGFFAAILGAAGSIGGNGVFVDLEGIAEIALPLTAIVIFALSWYISVKVYKNREL